MGRPRKPTDIQEAKGHFKKHPERLRQAPEAHGPLGEPPEQLSAGERAAWREIAEAAPEGVLHSPDRFLLEITAVLLAQSREAPETFTAAKGSQLLACLGKMGMSPADRSRVAFIAQTEREENPFDRF